MVWYVWRRFSIPGQGNLNRLRDPLDASSNVHVFPTTMSNRTCSTPPLASKRHSLNISTGPRPLHLVDGNVPVPSPSLATAPLNFTPQCYSPSSADTFTPPPSARGIHNGYSKPRRQSSISYNRRDNDADLALRSPLGPRPGLTRSYSLGPKSPLNAASKADRRSVGPNTGETETRERAPITLAEKYVLAF